MLVVRGAPRQAGETGAVGADDVELPVRQALSRPALAIPVDVATADLVRCDVMGSAMAPWAVQGPNLQHTNLGRTKVRDRVNLECDMVGKYVVRAAELAGLTLGVRPGEMTH